MTKENAEKFYDNAELDLVRINIRHQISNESILTFRNAIADIKKGSHYNEGDKILPDDLDRIQKAAADLLKGFAGNLSKSWKAFDDDLRARAEASHSFMMVNDYLYAYAMKELGCPDIPTNFGEVGERTLKDLIIWTDFDGKEDAFNAADTTECFNKQRKKDAKIISKDFEKFASPIRNGKATPLDIAKYIGEYQALKMRQANHTAVWRFFHRGENKARTALLNNMKKTLENVLGKNAGIDTKTPAEIAKEYITKLVDKRTEQDFTPEKLATRHDELDPGMFKHNANEESNAKDDIKVIDDKDLNANLLNSLNESNKNTEISSKIPEEPKPNVLDNNILK